MSDPGSGNTRVSVVDTVLMLIATIALLGGLAGGLLGWIWRDWQAGVSVLLFGLAVFGVSVLVAAAIERHQKGRM